MTDKQSGGFRVHTLRARLLQALLLIVILVSVPAQSPSRTHVVRPNDTIYSLARSFGITPAELMAANGISDPTTLSIGRRLVIPDDSGTELPQRGTAAQQSSHGAAARTINYTVVRSDTWYGVARRHGLGASELASFNGRSEDEVLRLGEVIRIPVESGSGTPVSLTEDPAFGNTAPSNDNPAEGTSIARNQPLSAGGLWPVAGSRYRMEGKFPGVLIVGTAGETVRSVSEGRTIYAGPYRTFGLVVIVQSSSGHAYIYGGNDELLVSYGEAVEPGTPIGTLGVAPGVGEAQLLFGVYKDDNYVDPVAAPRG